MSIILEKYEKAVAYEILINREYKSLDNIIFDSKVILDIGGHFGFFTAYVLLIKVGFYNNSTIKEIDKIDSIINSLQIKGDFLVHFFEPVKSYFDQAKNVLSKFENNVIFNNLGILDKNGEFNIYKPKISSQTSLYKSFMNNGDEVIKCNFITLEKYLKNKNINQIDLLKMDVEGAEFDVLLNLDEKSFGKIKAIFLEYHLLDTKQADKLDTLLTKLNNHYSKVIRVVSGYNNKLGYILCTDSGY